MLTLNVNEHTEKKQNLTYLSWAWAWAEALKADPNATFKVRTFGDQCWMDVHGTAMVWVDVTMFGKTQECFLPVMDHRNKPIADPDAFQVNTALMRCLTKCLALFGLGLYIYAGEDLPEDSEQDKKPEPKKVEVKEKKAEPKMSAEDARLFADGMVEFVIVAKTYDGLKSYWMSNQGTLDTIRDHYPEEYERVLKVFRERKEQLEGAKSE